MVEKSPFITEAAIEFSIAIFAVILRLFSRWKLVGFKRWGGDDYLCIVATILCIYLMIPVFLVGQILGSNTGWTPEERAAFTKEDIQRMETGSKLAIAGWFSYVSILWSLKGAVLFYYSRIMSGVAQQKVIRVSAVYCGLSYIAVVLSVALHCRPFHKIWQINPDPGRECTAHYNLYLVVVVFNVTTDILLVYIPIPVLVHLRIKLIQKIMIGTLLCSGLFIIIAALLRCILSLIQIAQINHSAIWAAREMFVAFVAVNAPAIKPLFNPSTWKRASTTTNAAEKRYSQPQAQVITATKPRSLHSGQPILQRPPAALPCRCKITHCATCASFTPSPTMPDITAEDELLYWHV
ncbi:hypothetical protein BDV12DRAFT_172676 [Aspergillus spectabilis]